MRDGIEARCDGHREREGEGEVDVVNDDFGKDLQSDLSSLGSILGLTNDGSGLWGTMSSASVLDLCFTAS